MLLSLVCSKVGVGVKDVYMYVGYKNVTAGSEAALMAAIMDRPVSIAVDAE